MIGVLVLTFLVELVKVIPPVPFEKVECSYYGHRDGLHGQVMANGETFDMNDPTIAAHRNWPFGTRVLLHNPDSKKAIEVVIQDRGPFVPGRDLDLSYAGARKLDFVEQGVARLEVIRLEPPT